MIRQLVGVFAPVVTTFGRDGDLSQDPFQANLRAHLAAGIDGVVVAGSTGEAPLLDERERGCLLDWAKQVVPAERWLIAGVGAESTRLTVRRSRDAAERGADAVLVVAPHYYAGALGARAIEAHYRRVADESPIPVLLYNIPKYTHFVLEPEMVRGLAGHENVHGMKDSSGDLGLLDRYLEAQSDRFTVLTGSASTFAAALVRGARGGVLAASLFAPRLTRELFERATRGDEEGARESQDRLTPLGTEIVAGLGVAGVKAALDRVGLAGGAVRQPLLPLAESDRERVAELLRTTEPTVAS